MEMQMEMQQEAKATHSPLPWKLHNHGVETMGHGVVYTAGGAHRKAIIEAANGKLAEFERLVFDADDRQGVAQLEADARFIVRAVSNHYALIEALGYVAEVIPPADYRNRDDSDQVQITVTVGWLREVADALSAAQEQS